jgi:hypothetical protein
MPRRPDDPRVYVSMVVDTDWTDSPQPCGCKIERETGDPTVVWASLCLVHAFAPFMYDCLRQIVSTPLRGDAAISAATEVLGRMESIRMNTQIADERKRRLEQREARKRKKRRRERG